MPCNRAAAARRVPKAVRSNNSGTDRTTAVAAAMMASSADRWWPLLGAPHRSARHCPPSAPLAHVSPMSLPSPASDGEDQGGRPDLRQFDRSVTRCHLDLAVELRDERLQKALLVVVRHINRGRPEEGAQVVVHRRGERRQPESEGGLLAGRGACRFVPPGDAVGRAPDEHGPLEGHSLVRVPRCGARPGGPIRFG